MKAVGIAQPRMQEQKAYGFGAPLGRVKLPAVESLSQVGARLGGFLIQQFAQGGKQFQRAERLIEHRF